jgi:CO/xanthine dehydrogenase FAD-binding subunit
VDFLQPRDWDEALALRAEHPDALAVNGGTDVLVDLNFDRRRPAALLDLSKVASLRDWDRVDGEVRLGAGVPYARVVSELGDALPGLAMASRTVGSPQIRNRGTVAATSARHPPPATRTRRCWRPVRLWRPRRSAGCATSRSTTSSPGPSAMRSSRTS